MIFSFELSFGGILFDLLRSSVVFRVKFLRKLRKMDLLFELRECYIFGEVYPVVSASLSYDLKNIFLRIMFYQKKGHFFLFVIFWVI